MDNNFSQGSNSFIGDLQAFMGYKKEISGESAIIRNNGSSGALSGKAGFELALPLPRIGELEELCRRIRIQNNLPSYEQIVIEQTAAADFSGRVAEVWKEIEADGDLIAAIIAVRDGQGEQQSIFTLSTEEVNKLASELCVIELREDRVHSVSEDGTHPMPSDPSAYRITPGVGAAILKRIKLLESESESESGPEIGNDALEE